MAGHPDPRLFPYADHVLDRIEADDEHGGAIRDAVAASETLELDFHPHADGGGWCAAVRVAGDGASARDLVHLRGIVRTREECAPMGRALAGLLAARHRLLESPAVLVEGVRVYA